MVSVCVLLPSCLIGLHAVPTSIKGLRQLTMSKTRTRQKCSRNTTPIKPQATGEESCSRMSVLVLNLHGR